jgi:hypothetical protein
VTNVVRDAFANDEWENAKQGFVDLLEPTYDGAGKKVSCSRI